MAANTVAYEKITNALIEALQGGTIPWRKPWQGFSPMNAFTKRAYRGINAILLGISKYSDPRWATYNQITAAGGQVRKGEKSTPVAFWKWFENEDKKTGKKSRVPYLKYYAVFNVEQADGLKIPALADLVKTDNSPIEAAEEIAAGYVGKPTITGSQAAWYQPNLDIVGMPAIEQFESAESYYATLFHEYVHSTGHVNRLNREEVVKGNRFGSGDYSKEELVAEFGAFFLCSAAGIANERIEENATAYLQNWIARLKDDVKMAVQAAGRAQRAADYILGIKQEEDTTEGATPTEVEEVQAAAV